MQRAGCQGLQRFSAGKLVRFGRTSLKLSAHLPPRMPKDGEVALKNVLAEKSPSTSRVGSRERF